MKRLHSVWTPSIPTAATSAGKRLERCRQPIDDGVDDSALVEHHLDRTGKADQQGGCRQISRAANELGGDRVWPESPRDGGKQRPGRETPPSAR